MNRRMRRLSEVVKERRPQGEYVAISDILDQEIVITSVREGDAKYGDVYVVEFLLGNKEMFTFTSSQAIIEKLTLVADALPLIARFVARRSRAGRRYYDVE